MQHFFDKTDASVLLILLVIRLSLCVNLLTSGWNELKNTIIFPQYFRSRLELSSKEGTF